MKMWRVSAHESRRVILSCCLLFSCRAVDYSADRTEEITVVPVIADVCQETLPQDAQFRGLLGDRIDRTAENRLRWIAGHPLLLQGFTDKEYISGTMPGTLVYEDPDYGGPTPRAWLGEHAGKWLHAATVLALTRQDQTLRNSVQSIADALVSHQDPDGYLGTYDTTTRFTAPPGNFHRSTWDIWEHRYNLYGLLAAYRYLGGEQWLTACRKMGDLLITVLGPGGRDITGYGTRRGLSSLTILESVTQLYKMTGDTRYLDFAKYLIYTASETQTKVLSKLLAREGVYTIGDGKAYQLMAVMLGMLDLYQYTGDPVLYTAVLNGWDDIVHDHITITGGTWSRKINAVSNDECLAPESYWTPFEHVENCAAVTWLQLMEPPDGFAGPAWRLPSAQKNFESMVLLPYYQVSSRNTAVATWLNRVP